MCLQKLCILCCFEYYTCFVAGIYIGHCLYAVKPNLALGLEALMQRGMHPMLGQVTTQFSGSLAARYTSMSLYICFTYFDTFSFIDKNRDFFCGSCL